MTYKIKRTPEQQAANDAIDANNRAILATDAASPIEVYPVELTELLEDMQRYTLDSGGEWTEQEQQKIIDIYHMLYWQTVVDKQWDEI